MPSIFITPWFSKGSAVTKVFRLFLGMETFLSLRRNGIYVHSSPSFIPSRVGGSTKSCHVHDMGKVNDWYSNRLFFSLHSLLLLIRNFLTSIWMFFPLTLFSQLIFIYSFARHRPDRPRNVCLLNVCSMPNADQNPRSTYSLFQFQPWTAIFSFDFEGIAQP